MWSSLWGFLEVYLSIDTIDTLVKVSIPIFFDTSHHHYLGSFIRISRQSAFMFRIYLSVYVSKRILHPKWEREVVEILRKFKMRFQICDNSKIIARMYLLLDIVTAALHTHHQNLASSLAAHFFSIILSHLIMLYLSTPASRLMKEGRLEVIELFLFVLGKQQQWLFFVVVVCPVSVDKEKGVLLNSEIRNCCYLSNSSTNKHQ